jgi:hypothetical protein
VETIFDYLLALKDIRKHQTTRHASPTDVLQIPRDAPNDPAIASLATEIVESATIFAISFHFGHILYKHTPGILSPLKSREHVERSGCIALEIMRRNGRTPYGTVLHLQMMDTFEVQPLDFTSEGKRKQYEL